MSQKNDNISRPAGFDYLVDEVLPMEQEWFDNERLMSEDEMNQVDTMYRSDEELEEEFSDNDEYDYDPPQYRSVSDLYD